MFRKINSALEDLKTEDHSYEIILGKYEDSVFNTTFKKKTFLELKKKMEKKKDFEVSFEMEKHYINFNQTVIVNNKGEKRMLEREGLQKLDIKTSVYDLKLYQYLEKDMEHIFLPNNYHSINRINNIVFDNDIYKVSFRLTTNELAKVKKPFFSVHFVCKNKVKVSKKNPLRTMLKDIEKLMDTKEVILTQNDIKSII